MVPENYSEQQARDFAARLAAVGGISPLSVLGVMTSAFWPGGSEELQRNPRWGIPPNSFVRAYTSAASDHFGYVTAAAGLPQELAQIGGGLHNSFSKRFEKDDIDTNGKFGLSKINEANIAQGYAAGAAASKPPAPFNDYGYNPRPRAAAGQIGDGIGISPFTATLSGINPNEPEPPEWPPQQSSPVRFLSSKYPELNEARSNGR